MPSPPLPPAAADAASATAASVAGPSDAVVSAGETTGVGACKEVATYVVPRHHGEQLQQQEGEGGEMSGQRQNSTLPQEDAEEQQDHPGSALLTSSQWLRQPNSPSLLHDVLHASSWSQEQAASKNNVSGSSLVHDATACSVLPLCGDSTTAEYRVYTQTNVPLPASLCHSTAAAALTTATPSCLSSSSRAGNQEMDDTGVDGTYEESSRGGYETPSGTITSHYNGHTTNNTGSNGYTNSHDGKTLYGENAGDYGGSTDRRGYESENSSSYEQNSGSNCEDSNSSSSHRAYERSPPKYESNCGNPEDYDSHANTDYENSHGSAHCVTSTEYGADENFESITGSSSSTSDVQGSTSEPSTATAAGSTVPGGATISSLGDAARATTETAAEAETDGEADAKRNAHDTPAKKESPVISQVWGARELAVQHEHEYLCASPSEKTDKKTGSVDTATTLEMDVSDDPTTLHGTTRRRPSPLPALYSISNTHSSGPSSLLLCANQAEVYTPMQGKDLTPVADTEQSLEADPAPTPAVVASFVYPGSSASVSQPDDGNAAVPAISTSQRRAGAEERQRKRNAAAGGAAASATSTAGTKQKASAARGGERRRKTKQQQVAVPAEKKESDRRRQRAGRNSGETPGAKSRSLTGGSEATVARAPASSRLQQNSLLLFSPVPPPGDSCAASATSSSCAASCKETFFSSAQRLAAGALMMSHTLVEGETEATTAAEPPSPSVEKQQQHNAACLDSSSYSQQVKHSYLLSPRCWGGEAESLLPAIPRSFATGKMTVVTQQQQLQQQPQRSSFAYSSVSSPLLLCTQSSLDASGASNVNRNTSGTGSRSSSGGGCGSSTMRYTSATSSAAAQQEERQTVYSRTLRVPSAALSKEAEAAAAAICPYTTTFSPLHWDPSPHPDSARLYLASRVSASSAGSSGSLFSCSSQAAGPAAPVSPQASTPTNLTLHPSFTVCKTLSGSSSSNPEETTTATCGRRPTAPAGSAATEDPSTSGTTAGSTSDDLCRPEAGEAKEQSSGDSRNASTGGRYLSPDALEHASHNVRPRNSTNADCLSGAATAVAAELAQLQQEQREVRSRGNSSDTATSSIFGNSTCARCTSYRSSNSTSSSNPPGSSGYERNGNPSRYPSANTTTSPSICGTDSLSSTLGYNSSSHSNVFDTSGGIFERGGGSRPHDCPALPEETYNSCCDDAESPTTSMNSKPSSSYNAGLQEAFASLPLPPVAFSANTPNGSEDLGTLPHSPAFSASSIPVGTSGPLPSEKLTGKNVGEEILPNTATAVSCEALTTGYPLGDVQSTGITETAAGANLKSGSSISLLDKECGSSACNNSAVGASSKGEKSNGVVAAVAAAAAALPTCFFHNSSSPSLGAFSFSSSAAASSWSSSSYPSFSSSLPATFPNAFSSSYSSTLLQNSLLSGRCSGAQLRHNPSAAAGGNRRLHATASGGGGGKSAAGGTAGTTGPAGASSGGNEQQQQALFGGSVGSNPGAFSESLSPAVPAFNSTATAAAAHMSILSNVLYSSYEHPGQIKAYSSFPLSAATAAAGMHTRHPTGTTGGSPLMRHVAATGPAGGNGMFHIAAAAYHTLTPRALSPTTLSTQTSVHDDVVACIPDNTTSSEGGVVTAGARSAAAAAHALRQQHLGAQQLLFQATLQDALASAEVYTHPIPYSSSGRATGGGGGAGGEAGGGAGGAGGGEGISSHIKEMGALSPLSGAHQPHQHQRCSAAGESSTPITYGPSLSHEPSLHSNAPVAPAVPRLDVLAAACAGAPNNTGSGSGGKQQQTQQQNNTSSRGVGGGWGAGSYDSPVTLAADGWMAMASCCGGQTESAAATGSRAWQDPEQLDLRDCFHYYLSERPHPGADFCGAAAAGFAAAAGPLHAHYKRGWGRDEGTTDHHADLVQAGGGAAAKKLKVEGSPYPSRNAMLPQDDWHEGNPAAAEAAAAALVAAAAAGACGAAAGGGSTRGAACTNAGGVGVLSGNGNNRCYTNNTTGTVGGPLRLPRKLFSDARRWSAELTEDSDLEIDPNIQWHEGFTLPLGKDGRGELIKRMRAVHKAVVSNFFMTLEAEDCLSQDAAWTQKRKATEGAGGVGSRATTAHLTSSEDSSSTETDSTGVNTLATLALAAPQPLDHQHRNKDYTTEDREFYRFTLEEMGIDFKRLAHATVEELWKIAFRWGLFPYAIKLSRKYGRTNTSSSRKKAAAAAAATGGGGAGATGGKANTGESGAGEVNRGAGAAEGGGGPHDVEELGGCTGKGGGATGTEAAEESRFSPSSADRSSSSSPPLVFSPSSTSSSSSSSPSSSSSSTTTSSTFASAPAPSRQSVLPSEAENTVPAAEESPQAGGEPSACDPLNLPSPHGGTLDAEGTRAVIDIDWV